MATKQINILLCFLLFTITAGAQYIEFVENKGQWNSELKYLGNAESGSIALTKDGYAINQRNMADYSAAMEHLHHSAGSSDPAKTGNPEHIVRQHAWFVRFQNANPEPEIIASKQQPGHNNYFLGDDRSRWAAECRIFTAITYKNMYPGIDVQYYTDNNSLKYDIVAAPGSNPGQISFIYDGPDKLSVNRKGELVIATSVGSFTESFPYTYQVVDNQRRQIDCKFKVKGNRVSFSLGDYDPKLPLVIDPVLFYCSFTRSSGDNWGFTATYGPDGSLYAGGHNRASGFPTTGGAYQQNFQGGETDISIMKFTPVLNTRVYATYIGGGDADQPHSLVCEGNGSLVVAGRSKSANYPATARFGTLGGWDIVVTRLNANGSGITGSVKIGGSGDDGVNVKAGRSGRSILEYNYGDDGRSEVNEDAAGNIILASCTQSDNFPLAGAVQTTFGGGQDAVILKLNSALNSLVFSTYFGGNSYDAAYVINVNPGDGDIYFAGGTESANLPGDKTGVIQPTYGGNIDGFVGVMSANGSTLRKVTYLGTGSHDQVYGLQFDRNNFPYVMGISLGSWPVINAAFSNTGSHQFVGKLKKDLSGWEYSTKFGTNNAQTNISPVAFLVDNCENVYVAGWGGIVSNTYPNAGTNGMPITADAIQPTTDGSDIYFFVLRKNAAGQLFGSYYGANSNNGSGFLTDHIDGGTSRFDPKGAIYMSICACSSTPGPNNSNINSGAGYPTTGGVWSRVKGAITGTSPTAYPLCNLIALKVRFNLTGVSAGLKLSDTSGCVPMTVNFSDTMQNGVTYEWDFGDGSPLVTTTDPNTTYTYNTPGTYRARLVSTDLNTCNQRDTAYRTVRVRTDPAAVDFAGFKQQPCENLSYLFVNNSVPAPGKNFTNTSFLWDFGDGSPLVPAGMASQLKTFAGPGNYNVKLILVDTNFCNAPDTAQKIFRVAPFVDANFVVNNGCAPYDAEFTNTSLAGMSFEWSFGDGNFSTDINPVHRYNTPGTYDIVLVANDTNTCNKTDTARGRIVVFPSPTSSFTYGPIPIQENTPTQFNNQSLGAVRYIWDFGDGEMSEQVNPLHQFNATDTFNVCLVAVNDAGCSDTFCLRVPALVAPLFDVPNALSPNNDGKNDKIYVRGFGIKTMTWRIYNRYGQTVFMTTNRNEGWDGKYKGVVQPMEVYGYTLEIETSDGKKVSKQGDITLIR